LHWDSKLLRNIVDGVQKEDQVAVLVSGGGLEKLLAVPEIIKETVKEQADACLTVLDEWELKAQVH
jgi:glycerate-2-kinase